MVAGREVPDGSTHGSDSRRLKRLVRVAAAVVFVGAVALAVVTIIHTWQSDYRTAKRSLDSVLVALGQYLETTLGGMEALLVNLGTRYVLASEISGDLSETLEAAALPMPIVRTLLLIDRDGVVVAESRPGRPAVGLDVGDRAYFQIHRTARRPLTIVAPPVRSRVDGEWAVPISHGLRAPGGALRAVLVVAVSSASLDQILADLGARVPGMSILFGSNDGVVDGRWPTEMVRIGTAIADGAVVRERLTEARGEAFWAPLVPGGPSGLVMYRGLESLPVFVAAGIDQGAIFADTTRQGIVWACILVVTGLLMGATVRHFDRIVGRLDASRVAAEAADRRKNEFLTNMSHEIRTPLNAIIGFAAIMHEDDLRAGIPKVYADYARDIQESGRYLLGVVDELLDLSVISARGVALSDDVVDPVALVTELVQIMQVRARANAIDLSVEPSPGSTPMVRADARRLSQILMNLLSNAVKYTQPGGTVRTGVRAGPEGLHLYVRDNGPGIGSERIEAIMEPFQRDGVNEVASSEGIGLGLAIARGLTEAHGGTLLIVSAAGKGTDAIVSLPMDRVLPEGGTACPPTDPGAA
ncbi:hypothetical protein F1188_08675 [Roseospira marina]|uniref:histidine kinase n=1 Tax=Roseospira marina TaxID=140057 RepID=A0A5M6IDC7_9PROT|nr:ATP-binding protein [Roseospira marina]KAA5606072.1 hypothetical protein F1188_08675 [Roseospira marina]MBB4313063.1 signal transduction histidine kinase [Roseospira marina]MBB5086196.1 signal transduction histidine kinase [Roseospira marina]